jgi:hypothetical protein
MVSVYRVYSACIDNIVTWMCKGQKVKLSLCLVN